MTTLLPPALILAGGRSSRMGTNKASLPFGSRTLLTRVLERLESQASEVAVNAPASLQLPPGVRRVPDTLPDQPGPLAGVLAGIRDAAGRGSAATHLLTVPSDAPFFPSNLTRRLMSATADPDAVAIASSAQRSHPVFGLWPLSLANDLEDWLADGRNRRMFSFLERHRVVTVEWELISTDLGPLDPFMNLNTPADLEAARRFLEIAP